MKQTDILSLLQQAESVANSDKRPAEDAPSSYREPVDAPSLASGLGAENERMLKEENVTEKPKVERLRSVGTERLEELPPVAPATARTDMPVKPDAVVGPSAVTPSSPAEGKVETPVKSGDGGGGGPSEPKQRASWHDQVPTSHRGVVSKGLLFVFGFLAVFFAWSLLFPISSAVVANGKVISSGQNKLIQHPVGGVVKEIRVKEGEFVEKGKVILDLDKSATGAELSRLLARQQTLNAQKLRYETEQKGKNAKFPSATETGKIVALDEDKGAVGKIIEAVEAQKNVAVEQQRKEFEAGRKRLNAQLDTIAFQVETLKDQKTGLNSRLQGARKLLKLTERDLAKIRPLAADGYVPKSRLWDLEKTQLEQVTEIQNLTSQVAAIDQRISESESKLAEIDQLDREQRSEELSKVIGELAELREPIQAARNALQLTEIRAPVSGVVTNLAANTEGGVMPAGESVAEIVPRGAELEVEFRVPLNKSKYVNADKPVRVTMSTFNRRLYDPIDGKVSYVSADSLIDEQTGDSYFLARARLKDTPGKNTGISEISTGMSAEVYVVSEPRVFASYVLQPLIDSFNRAFREN